MAILTGDWSLCGNGFGGKFLRKYIPFYEQIKKGYDR